MARTLTTSRRKNNICQTENLNYTTLMPTDSSILQNFGGTEINSLNHVLHINVENDDETEGIEQIHVINHSPYYDNDMLLPAAVLLAKISSNNIECISSKFNELNIFVQEPSENILNLM